MVIRKYLDPELLALFYGFVSENSTGVSTVNNIKRRVLEFLVSWTWKFYPTISDQQRSEMGVQVGNKFLVWILDGTEQPTPKPTNSGMQGTFWSAKKKQFSINKLIACTPDGMVVWMSKSYPGRVTDAEIMHLELPQFTQEWKDNELILADAGFKGNYH